MAINKGKSPTWVKGVIIFVALTFVVSVGGLAALSATGSSSSGTSSQTGSADASGTVGGISKQYAAQTQALDDQIAKDPKNADLLTSQAQTYYQWANGVLTSTQDMAQARPMAFAAAQFFERAFAIRPGTSNDLADYAASVYYSGDVAKATAIGEKAVKADPKAVSVWFNLGVFYGNSGRNADALKAWQTALALDPTGQDAPELQKRIQQLQASLTATPSTSPTP